MDERSPYGRASSWLKLNKAGERERERGRESVVVVAVFLFLSNTPKSKREKMVKEGLEFERLMRF